MRKHTRKNDVVFLVTTDQYRDSRIVGLLRKHHGQDVEIHIRNSPKTLGRLHGLNSLIQQTKNQGVVYVVAQDIPRAHLTYAMDNGSSFGIISRKSMVDGQMSIAWFNYRGAKGIVFGTEVSKLTKGTDPVIASFLPQRTAVGAAS